MLTLLIVLGGLAAMTALVMAGLILWLFNEPLPERLHPDPMPPRSRVSASGSD